MVAGAGDNESTLPRYSPAILALMPASETPPGQDGDKQCSTCRVFKARSEFNRLRRAVDGLSPRCRDCHRLAQQATTLRKRMRNLDSDAADALRLLRNARHAADAVNRALSSAGASSLGDLLAAELQADDPKRRLRAIELACRLRLAAAQSEELLRAQVAAWRALADSAAE